MMYQHFYQKFLNGHKDKIHLAAHSHHFWPDVSYDAHIQYWLDASIHSDEKWSIILGEKLIKAQKHIAQILNLNNYENIAFASNTHELISRLLSSFLGNKQLRVLTTDSEFHSFARQIKRLEEFENVEVTYLMANEENFEKELLRESQNNYDLIFTSQVFFNTGKVLDLRVIENVVQLKSENTIFVLDGYHGFCAVNTDLSNLEDKIYYLSGGYKYAQAGEGMCFMTIPSNCVLRPSYTGWFASFSTLETSEHDKIQYDNNGWRFWGSTQDFSALYRFVGVWDNFEKHQINVDKIHNYIQSLQRHFIENFKASNKLVSTNLSAVGHFLTLNFSSLQNAQEAHKYLASKNVLTDFRGTKLRFGFGFYMELNQLNMALEILNRDDFISLIK